MRDRDAALCLGAVVVSGFGSSALLLVAGVWVKDLTGSDGLAALCALALWLPVCAGPLLGALADRVRRRPLLIAVNLGLGALLPVVLWVDSAARVGLLLAVLLVYGACGVVTDAAEAALAARAVGEELLGDFNGLRTAANEGMKLVAPPVGAALYAAYGGGPVALLDAVTFLLAAGLFALVRTRERRPAPGAAGTWRRTAAGARFLWRAGAPGAPNPGRGDHRDATRPLPLVLAGGLTMLTAGLSGATVYALVEGLGRSPAYTGVLYTAQGAGSVAAGLAAGALLRRLGARRLAGAGAASTAAGAAMQALPQEAAVVTGCLAHGAGLVCEQVAALTAALRAEPDALAGRVVATAQTLVLAPTALGIALGAALVELADPRLLLVLCAGARLAVAAPLLNPVRLGPTSRPPSA
ncbi:MFS transporter [Streptomyces longispororuber]|uniref:MFS transporter n=1 Tax=Streptomyces longispororuber TaxID=68230 RepID=A0A918ZJS9_9ACTN|nr:MFS transporter [Streptomyces longispororuber]